MNFYEVEDLPIVDDDAKLVKFYTAILTYPSDFQQQLSVGIITQFLQKKFQGLKFKAVVAREDADIKIQRDHFHIYLDFDKQFQVRPKKYFDIPLPHRVVCFIRDDKTRTYEDYNELESKLGWDNDVQMAELLSSYAKEGGFEDYKVLSTAHPNLQIKKKYGSKYQMLRYVVKQGLIARANFDINREIVYLEDNEVNLREKFTNFIERDCMSELDISIMDELLSLAKDLLNKFKKQIMKGDIKKKDADYFAEWLKDAVSKNVVDQNEIYRAILEDQTLWKVYLRNVMNVDKVIQRMVRPRPVVPDPDYVNHNIFYLPRKLYDYVMWLDDWVRRWCEGIRPLEDRPKGLVIISPSRYCKTALMIALGPITYVANTWNMDQWSSSAAYNLFDDMDPVDKEKGHTFSWFKGFFGAQNVLDITDKYRPKRTVTNGKPLVWLSNYELSDSFKNEKDLDYIEKNMVIVRLTRPLNEPAEEWIEGHSDYVKFDTRNTYWYQKAWKAKVEQQLARNEEIEEEEPLDQRKRRLSFTQEAKNNFEENQGRLLWQLEQKIEKINWCLNEHEKQKLKLECELTYINNEYATCQQLFQNNKDFIQYQQILVDRSYELCNLINVELVKIDKLQEWKKLCIDCYYYVDKAYY